MSAVCPKCGVAVVPGYVRCPKCQTALPQAPRAASHAAGGTAVSGGGFPLVPVLGGVALLGVIIVVIATRGGDKKPATPAPTTAPATSDPSGAPDPTPRDEPELTASPTPTPSAPDPTNAIIDLDRALKTERLWGTVEVIGARVDVRTGACADPKMAPVLDAAIPPLRSAGLTRLRCLEQSGAVVFERDL